MNRYTQAKEIYAKWGVDTDKAIEILKLYIERILDK